MEETLFYDTLSCRYFKINLKELELRINRLFELAKNRGDKFITYADFCKDIGFDVPSFGYFYKIKNIKITTKVYKFNDVELYEEKMLIFIEV